MPVDLFFTNKDRLKLFLKSKRYWKTHEIIRWGVDNYSNRANRYKQELVQEGFLRHLPQEEKYRLFGMIKEDVYESLEYVGVAA